MVIQVRGTKRGRRRGRSDPPQPPQSCTSQSPSPPLPHTSATPGVKKGSNDVLLKQQAADAHSTNPQLIWAIRGRRTRSGRGRGRSDSPQPSQSRTSPPPPPPPHTSASPGIIADSTDNPSTKKKTRRATTLQQLTASRGSGQRLPIEFDAFTGQPMGDHAAKFKSYVGMLARSKASILAENWRKVHGDVKELIWRDILKIFDAPNDENLKKYWISYAGERWKSFKTTLTRTYIFGDGDNDGNTTPCGKYSFIDEETWQMFVRSREGEEFQSKRQKARENVSKNVCHHRLSRGGYQKLKEKMKEDALKAAQEEAGDAASVFDPPSPPRHELWKMARLKPTGSYTTEASASIASRIDSLVEQSTQGTFVPHERQDILTTAIGIPEHPGRVRTAGRGVGLKKYYGGPSRCGPTSGAIPTEQWMNAMRQEILQQVTQSFNSQIEKTVMEKLASMGCIHQNSADHPECSPRDTVHVSTKGSCSPNNVDEPPKHDWLKELIVMALELRGGSAKINLEHEHHEHYYVDKRDLMDLCLGDQWIGSTHLQLWCTYLHRQCITKGISHVYRFLDPFIIGGSTGRSKEVVQAYIENKLFEEQKVCYLAPYLNDNHWQLLVLFPSQNIVVWMCPLHYKPDAAITRIVDLAMTGYNRLTGGLKKKKPDWVVPLVPKQNNSYACGYCVMKYMLTIVSEVIVDNWKEIFNDKSTFNIDEIDHIRQTWAEFFVIIYSEQKNQPLDNQ